MRRFEVALPSSVVRSLKKKAADNSLEVEDLLKVAARGDASDAMFLRRLKDEHAWSDSGLEHGARVVPFGQWVNVICCYLERGYGGLVDLAGVGTGGDDVAGLCVGLLEELNTPASVTALLAMGGNIIERPETDLVHTLRLARAFNRLLSFKDAPAVDMVSVAKIREFLHRALALELSEAERATFVYALRGVGDNESLRLIGELPRFQGPYAGLGESASGAIKKNLCR
jgi:hypothetical protein